MHSGAGPPPGQNDTVQQGRARHVVRPAPDQRGKRPVPGLNLIHRLQPGNAVVVGPRLGHHLDKLGVSPDGEWVIAFLPGDATIAVPIHGGAARRICARRCYPAWSSVGSFLYVDARAGTTLAIPVPAGQSLPDLPAAGIDAAAGVVGLPGAWMIEHDSVSPGPDPSTYVFTKRDLQRNLFRIPLH